VFAGGGLAEHEVGGSGRCARVLRAEVPFQASNGVWTGGIVDADFLRKRRDGRLGAFIVVKQDIEQVEGVFRLYEEETQ